MYLNDSGDGFIKGEKLLDRVQAVIPPNNIIILAAIRKPVLKSELAFNNYSHISLKFDINVSTKSVKV